MASFQKGSCEDNHERFRYILPKGMNFDEYTQNEFNLITSHVKKA